jgi:acyl-CoA dehydrogenase
MSAAFAFIADAVLLTLGGKFKFREKLSGRLADAVMHLYLASAMLKRFQDDGCPDEDLPLLRWGMADSLHTLQQSLLGVLRNFPVPLLGRLLRLVVFPLGLPYSPPCDRDVEAVARLLTDENESRERLLEGVFISDRDDATGRVNRAFPLVLQAAAAERAIRNALRQTVNFENYETLVARARESGIVTEEQAVAVQLAQKAIAAVIAVDEFPRGKPGVKNAANS